MEAIMNSKAGSVLVSVILGLGLAAIFRRACTGDGCVVLKAPNAADVRKHVWKVDDDCFRYTPRVVECPRDARGVAKP